MNSREQAIIVARLLGQAKIICGIITAREAFSQEDSESLLRAGVSEVTVPDVSGIPDPSQMRDAIEAWLENARTPIANYKDLRNRRASTPVGVASQQLEADIEQLLSRATHLIELLEKE
jgi:hypothetical protein